MVEIKINSSSSDFLTEAKENGNITASLRGEIIDGVFNILTYEGDKYLFDGVCRAALNGAEHRGARSAVIKDSVPDWLLMLFGYERNIPSIWDFFEGKNCNCSCNCENNIV